MSNPGQETPANNDNLINMAESRPPILSAEGARASTGATESTEQAPYEARSTDIVGIMKDVGAAPDYDKTPPPSGDGLKPMSASPEMSLSSVPPHSKQIEITSIDSYGQSPKPQPELIVSTNDKALMAPSDKIESINSFKPKKDPITEEIGSRLHTQGREVVNTLFNPDGTKKTENWHPGSYDLPEPPVITDGQPVDVAPEEVNPANIPPMTPEQKAKIDEATKDAIGPRVFKHIMKGDPKNPLQ